MEEKINIHRKPPKSPAAAGILSAIFPFGIGAFYNGEYAKGVIYLFVFALLVSAQPHRGQPFLGLILAGFYFYQIIDSINVAKAINRKTVPGKEDIASPAEDLSQPLKSGSVFWGIVLVALGVVFLLANFDIISYGTLWDLWPAAIILVGLKLLVDYAMTARREK
ncbi:MAG: DUF5668 domain-containing protein [Acidobacteriota bacterium]|nr:DUF5668 domain-containing protein [Acidobacteriota bacterium]